MSGSFGGKDPFFTRSFKSFGSGKYGSASAAHDHPSQAQRSPAVVIQELDSDSMQTLRDKDGNNGQVGGGGDKYRENSWANRNPRIEHPDENQTDQVCSKNGKKIKFFGTDHSEVGSSQSRTSGLSFQRVTYGGINGPYYTASTTRRAGDDGVVIEESQQADRRTGQATHRISRGIHDKGHSVTRKLYSDGKVDMIQKLHNLYKDELDSFEETWRRNSLSLPPSSAGYFGGLNSSGSTSDLLFGRNFGGQVDQQLGYEMQSRSAATRGRSKKTILNIPIE